MNCSEPAAADALLVCHKRAVVAAVCSACLEGVKKPRVTLTRSKSDELLEGEQYSAVEVFSE